jgi:hypothetical protein
MKIKKLLKPILFLIKKYISSKKEESSNANTLLSKLEKRDTTDELASSIELLKNKKEHKK